MNTTQEILKLTHRIEELEKFINDNMKGIAWAQYTFSDLAERERKNKIASRGKKE